MSLFSGLSQALRGQKPASAPVARPTPKPVKIVRPQPTPQLLAKAKFDLAEAQAQAREIILEAKDQSLRIREQAEEKTRELVRQEATIRQKEQFISDRLAEVDQVRAKAKEELAKIEDIKQDQLKKLEKVASLTRDEAKQQLLQQLDTELSEDTAKRIREAEERIKEEAEEKAKEILVDAMKHGATDYVTEYTVSSVKLPDEEVKGRIIGKEGRNIRAFEQATGVDVDLDETPGEVRLSSFDPVRREVARITLQRLVADGRIQPTRIEEYVDKVRQELERVMFEEGKNLAHAVGVYTLPREILSVLGRFKFRFSYGQNMIAHTLEETKIGIALAREVGANVDTVRLGCLLHDIGKVVTDEEGSHVQLGVKLLEKFHIPQVAIDCVAQHHEDTPFTSKEAVLVYIADAISGARPGARYENYDDYVKRLSKLEELAKSFAGVAEAYAIQAGREVRVIVNPSEVNDAQATKLAHLLKTKIQGGMTYPGTVKVTVIRETRSTDVAT